LDQRTNSFGYWLRRRRKALDLTQEALGQKVSCSSFTIRKIEADERRPSRHLAERLAGALAITGEERPDFLAAARAIHTTDRLQLDQSPVGTDVQLPVNDISGESAPFVGRGNEYGMLIGLVARLTVGTGYTALIEGEPGIGKSRLLHEIADYAKAQGLPVLTTNCYEIERATPYQPVVDLVTRALDRLSADALNALAPVSLAELSALVPEISERVPGLPQLSNDFPEARQARLCRAVDQLLEAARDSRPAIFIVDDIQWADDASVQVMHYFARHASQRPVLMILAYRDEAVSSDERFAQLIESLRREGSTRRVSLGRLDFSDTERLVEAFANVNPAAPGLAERLHRETDGNPFFLMSILQALSEGESELEPRPDNESTLLPDALRAAVRARLAHVPKPMRPLLETAAVIGRRFEFDTLLEVTREPEEQLFDAVETLVNRRLLREEPEGGVYDFCHDKLREVVYTDIGGARRRQLHESVAETLERLGEGESHERDARLAEHYERAHSWTKALHYLLLAAEHSQALFAMRDALHWFDRAVTLSELHPESLDPRQRLALYEKRGAARAQAGQTQGAVSDMRRVIDVMRAGGERAKTRDILIQLGMAYRRADEYEEATKCLTEALEESRAMNDEHQAADTLYHLGTVAWSTGKNDLAIMFHQQAVEICERTGFKDLVAVQAYHGRGEAHFANAEPGAAIECYNLSLALARGINDKSYESENLMMIGHACLGTKGTGDYSRAIASFEAAIEIARTADLQWHFGPTLLGIDHARACLGQYGEAWVSMQKTLNWLEGLNQVRYQFIALDCIGHLLLDIGREELAIEYMKRGLALSQDSGINFWRAALNTHLAVAQSRLGVDVDIDSLRASLEVTRQSSEQYMMLNCLNGLAEISIAAGDTKRSLAYSKELLAISETNGLREIESMARRWRAKAMIDENKYDAAQAELSHAWVLAEETGRARLQLDIQADMARLLDLQKHSDAALKHLDAATLLKDNIIASLKSAGIEARI